MPRLTFLNLPVKDLARTKEFFTSLGFSFNPQFTDDKSGCLIIQENASYVMLITHEFFNGFIPGRTIAPEGQTEMIYAITANSREEVDAMLEKVIAGGGKDYRKEDHGWMYNRAFTDLDGHIWEVAYMDMSAMPQAQQ
jgi:uncharacterized protein